VCAFILFGLFFCFAAAACIWQCWNYSTATAIKAKVTANKALTKHKNTHHTANLKQHRPGGNSDKGCYSGAHNMGRTQFRLG
jgi:hypothetical protein